MPLAESNNKSTENPYDFIVNEPPKQRKPSLFSGQTSFKQRILVILGGGIVLIILIVIFASIFSSKPKTAGIVSVGQQQTTLITLATSADTAASQQITKNLATNVKLSLTSGQLSLINYLEATGSKITAISLLTSQTALVSKQLAATPANNFDYEYVQLAQSELTSYVSAIKQVYSSNNPASQKVLLSNLYVSASLLLKEANTAASDLQ